MKSYVAWGLVASLLGHGTSAQAQPSTPHYISGEVKGESFRYDGWSSPSGRYVFSVDTSSGIKIFTCRGENAQSLDALIDRGDKVKINVGNSNPNASAFDTCDVVEVNGKLVRLR